MVQHSEVHNLSVTVRTLKVRDLNAACANLNIPKTGVKAELQSRLLRHIQEAINRGDSQRYQEIQRVIYQIAHPGASHAFPTPSQPYGSTSHSSAAPTPQRAPNMPSPYNSSYGGGARPASAGLQFKPSPFYDMMEILGEVKTCEAMAQHRNQVSFTIRNSSHAALQKVMNDPSVKVMLFCAAANTGVQHIAFPYQCEVKVNGGEVKANLRGLKGKEGTTRPLDITPHLRFKPPAYENKLEFIYALTTKKFYAALYICQTHSIENLVSKIEQKPRISKASVISEMTRKAQDPDIEATSQVLSLQCPISYSRLERPVRSISCKHLQCFDASSYLLLQEQGPQWICPTCNKSAPFDDLAIDEYVKDILANTPKSVLNVTIEPNGTWRSQAAQSEEPDHSEDHQEASFLDDEDDDLVIFDPRATSTPQRPQVLSSTPNTVASREGSTMPRSTAGVKRTAAQVIDLTLSDDEDAPAPPPKRHQPHLATNGHNRAW